MQRGVLRGQGSRAGVVNGAPSTPMQGREVLKLTQKRVLERQHLGRVDSDAEIV